MRTVTLEEHSATQGFLDGPGRELKDQALKYNSSRAIRLIEQLCDVGDKRLAEMDASLPTAAPDKAAQELERQVHEQRFVGAVINGHNRGRYLDDKFFWPILECAEKLGAPIYLHPTPPPKPVIEASYSGFAPLVTQMLAGPGWGWHIETAVHIIRLILGGVFDRFPKLQVVIGHMGEGLPFMFQRMDIMPGEVTKLQRPVSAYLRENVHYTFGGFNFPPTFLDLLLELGGVGRIMFSADHPYQSMI